MRKISKNQIKIIHTLLSKGGVDDDLYRQILAKPVYGVESSTELSSDQASLLIGELFKMAGLEPKAKRTCRSREFASIQQKKMIEAMWKDVSRKKNEADRKKALNCFLERFGVSHIEWLSRRKVEKVVTALCAMGAKRPETYLNDINKEEQNG